MGSVIFRSGYCSDTEMEEIMHSFVVNDSS